MEDFSILKNAVLRDACKNATSPLDKLVARMAGKDPAGYSAPGMTLDKARIAAMLQDNLLRDFQAGTFQAAMNPDARDLYRAQNMFVDQKAVEQNLPAEVVARFGSFKDTTQGTDIATVTTQILPVISRAVAEDPIFDLVDSFVMRSNTANVVYFDVEYDSSGGAYSSGDRVDINDDPNYSDRTDCTASGRQLKFSVAKETVTATEKVLGAKLCLNAMQDAQAQYGLPLDSRMADEIVRQHRREWGRMVTDDIRTMAGKTGSWASTAPGPYTSLNTNEWRKELISTVITVDAAIRKAVYEPTEWLLTDPVAGAIMERVQRMHAPVQGNAQGGQVGSVGLSSGEFGPFVDRWKYYQDPFFAANTILIGRKTFNLVPNSPYYFLPYQMAMNVSTLFYPLTQLLEMAAQSRAGRKMIEHNAFGRIDIT